MVTWFFKCLPTVWPFVSVTSSDPQCGQLSGSGALITLTSSVSQSAAFLRFYPGESESEGSWQAVLPWARLLSRCFCAVDLKPFASGVKCDPSASTTSFGICGLPFPLPLLPLPFCATEKGANASIANVVKIKAYKGEGCVVPEVVRIGCPRYSIFVAGPAELKHGLRRHRARRRLSLLAPWGRQRELRRGV